MFGASLLWSALPLIILLSSLADERIDDDLSRHIGLNAQGARIVRTLFRGTPAQDLVAILSGFVFSFAGVIAVVGSLQEMYERIFGLDRLGWWRSLPRWLAWTAALLVLLAADAIANQAARHAAGVAAADLIGLVVTTLFFWWTLHFLLAGRLSWRRVARPAIATGVLWLGFGWFSSVYFSPILVSDSHTYGTIGVVFTLLTWLFLVGGVVILGALCGVVWEARAASRRAVVRSG